jgi:hypothetical protein
LRGTAISGNGRITAVVLELARPRSVHERLEKIGVRTDQVMSTLNDKAVFSNYEQIPWASQTGTTLIVIGAGTHGNGAGIYTGHQYTPIPWKANLMTAAW